MRCGSIAAVLVTKEYNRTIVVITNCRDGTNDEIIRSHGAKFTFRVSRVAGERTLRIML